MDRRAALTTLLSPALAALWRRAAASAPEMRVARIDTVYWESRDDAPFWPHWTWLRVHTPDRPGFGMRVKPEIWEHPKAIVRTSRL